ncbi:2-oxo-4-hydroxy-4-carboxy-5-ureidoimidazoline decarboxylase [Pseudonocardia ailaonensis]|uniref:2-oxo-4-hydroxy-4-carboxy-5-ureidoimidazoline decarboxylase n=1 Tax=Pseudonocardia ailaonensis TaxID=367279 RepID=A0ABN2N7A1_9PSEU
MRPGALLDPDPAALARCCRWPAFGTRLAALGPFTDVDALVTAAADLLTALADDELRTVLALYPPLGSPPGDHPAAGVLSEGEEAGLHRSGPDTVAQVRALAERYRARFGYTYLVAASGRSGEDLLADLRRRLGHGAAEELEAGRAELLRKCAIRLRGIAGPASAGAARPR